MTDRKYNAITTISLVIVIASGLIFPHAGAWHIPVLIAGGLGGIGSVICYFLYHWAEYGREISVHPTEQIEKITPIEKTGGMVQPNEDVPQFQDVSYPSSVHGAHAGNLFFSWNTATEYAYYTHHTEAHKYLSNVLRLYIQGNEKNQSTSTWFLGHVPSKKDPYDDMIKIITQLSKEPTSLEFEITASGNLLVRPHPITMSGAVEGEFSGHSRMTKEQNRRATLFGDGVV